MSISETSESQLSEDEKRQVLYAILLRHFPETQPLRDRAVDCLVLGALFGTTAESAMKLGEIQRSLRVGETTAALRLETIKPSVDRLLKEGKLVSTVKRFKRAYYLSSEAQQALSYEFQSSNELFTRCVRRMVAGVEPSALENSERVCRRFLSECFARFGRQIAKTVTGDITAQELTEQIDPSVAFNSACADFQCEPDDRALLSVRCTGFLKSSHPDDQKLKLYLTRAFYFASLLELDDSASRDLSRAEFAHSIVYLDTNIIIPTLLKRVDWSGVFLEVLNIARRLSIEVRVSAATINEARRVASIRGVDLDQVVAKLPEEILETTRDAFVAAFRERREDIPNVTVAELLEPFDNIRQIMQDEFGIVVDESAEQDFVLTSPEHARLKEVISRTAEELRGWSKSAAAVEHDCAEYLILEREAANGRRAFILTHDRTLIQAGLRYRGADSRPLHLSFLGFLQSIAPYVTAPEEVTFVEAFSRLLIDQLPPIEDALDIRELRVLADVYDDVQRTPPDQLVEAYHYVKRELNRKGMTKSLDPNQVVLGLRKFLGSSSEEKDRAMSQQVDALKASLAAKDKDFRTLSTSQAESINQKDFVIDQLTNRVSMIEARLEEERTNAAKKDRESFVAERTRRRLALLGAIVVSAAIWMLNEFLVEGLIVRGLIADRAAIPMRFVVDAVGACILLTFAFRLCSDQFVGARRRRGCLTLAIMISVYFMLRELDVGAWFASVEPIVSMVVLLSGSLLWVLTGDE